MVTCADAVEEAVRYHGGIVTSRQVFDYISPKFPNTWKDGTIRAHLMGCTVNHSSSHHYKHFRKFLFNVGPGRVRIYDPETDGRWKWTPEGMTQTDDDDSDNEIKIVDEPEDTSFVDSSQISFSMERDLELFLYNDIRALDPSLDLSDELENRQYNVSSGRIDILAKDELGKFVVIELKAGTAKDAALAQLLAYMTDISYQFDTENVRGIIVAHDFSEKLVKASRLVPSVDLKRYNISFSFESI